MRHLPAEVGAVRLNRLGAGRIEGIAMGKAHPSRVPGEASPVGFVALAGGAMAETRERSPAPGPRRRVSATAVTVLW